MFGDFGKDEYRFLWGEPSLLRCPAFCLSGYHRGVSNRAWSSKLGNRFCRRTAVQLKFDQSIRIDEARRAWKATGVGSAELRGIHAGQQAAHSREKPRRPSKRRSRSGMAVFSKEFPGNKFVVDSSMEIGPTIGKKLQEDAMIAVLISFVGIVLYIAVRFELRSGRGRLATFFTMCSRCWGLCALDKGNYLVGCDRIADAGRLLVDGYRGRLRPDPRISVPVGEKMRR